MNIAWINGWAVSNKWLRAQAEKFFAQHTHEIFTPTADTPLKILKKADHYDAFAGYSLGALLWLTHAEKIPSDKKLVLFAPFLAFCAEHKKGGRTRRAQLLYLKKWLRRDPQNALKDFYNRAGLPDFSEEEFLFLEEGLELLDRLSASGVPPNAVGFVGDDDGFINLPDLRAQWPAIEIISNANHNFSKLCAALPRDPFA